MITYGFYNSLNHDRKYDATQVGSIFDGIIRDGIYMSIGSCFQVVPGEDMMILVGTGRGWFDHSWILNDSIYPLFLSASAPILDRIDAIVIDINQEKEFRKNDIIVVEGTPATNPVNPTLIDEVNENGKKHRQYPLAYIYVEAGATEIRAANITSMVGSSATPYVTGILDTVNIDALVAKWEDQWNIFLEKSYEMKGNEEQAWLDWYRSYINENQIMIANFEEEFNAWFSALGDLLDEDTETKIYNEILKIKSTLEKGENVKNDLIKYYGIWDNIEDEEGESITDGNGSPIEGMPVKFKVEEEEIPTSYLEVVDVLQNDRFPIFRGQSTVLLQTDGLMDSIKSWLSWDMNKNFDIWDFIEQFMTSTTYDFGAILKRQFYRGYFLGNSVTSDQYAAIADGSFKGLFLGDNWQIGNVNWRIVDFDYWGTQTHHLVIMPDKVLYNSAMGTNETPNYYLSSLRNSGLSNARNQIKTCFGTSHILQIDEHYENLSPSSVNTYDDVMIPNEPMMYGGYIHSPKFRDTRDNTQLAGVRLNKILLNPYNEVLWLRDFISNTACAVITPFDIGKVYAITESAGVRPVFALKG